MNHRLFFILLTSLVLLFSATLSVAEDKKTLSVAYMQMAYKDGNLSVLNPSMISLQGSYRVLPNFSIEARLAFSYDTDRLSFENDSSQQVQKDIDISSLAGAYIKYQPLNPSPISPYVMAGMTHIEIEDTTVQINDNLVLDSRTGSDSSSSFGVGVEIQLFEKLAVSLDYMSYLNKDPFEVHGANISLGYRF